MADILIVEDDEPFSTTLVRMLTQDNHRVTVTRDGGEGLHRCRRHRPDLIVMDIFVPNRRGVEMIAVLAIIGMEVPVVAVSGGRNFMGAEVDPESASVLGIKAILAKAFSGTDLRRAVADALASSDPRKPPPARHPDGRYGRDFPIHMSLLPTRKSSWSDGVALSRSAKCLLHQCRQLAGTNRRKGAA